MYFDRSVKPSDSHKRFRHRAEFVCRRNYEHFLVFDLVDARLDRYVFLLILVTFVTVGELIQIVEKNYRRFLFGGRVEYHFYFVHKFTVRLVLAAYKLIISACVDQTVCH